MLKTMIQRTTLTRALVASLALLAPVSAANPAVTDAEFEQTFAPFDTEAPAPQVEGDVVDLAEIEPAVEAEPATTSLGSGVASYYGRKFHGRRTANGERFDMHAMTAAHRTLPFGSRVRVTNPSNGRAVVVRINDRGPYAHGRTIDLSRAAATEIGLVARGHGTVQLELLK
ncbi:MAG: septal ring lytic transglycosylase RlpA family protein [Sphingomonadaceae bacterium]|jgi:rare lipoprotein A|nr:septal ring lytic transglycosylase RlpA family protein [Sphingomonadaceae bacterium]MCB2087167.1 septal ring lytic transglycosylase RlpA family protein [Sphingomonadaceae bacterium]MCP5383673.1 septal ring lytic transglycosylase RlpA family protein [Altererythrobacter sp.]MCP5392027.1 septal ring lytic transglycosylase RlpA family protein [Sphingomonadaceae bacterium]MCP5394995.1 septal ring lytic transglycosylase RlpA family protein [Sphingomonadaceae bacterium]